MNKETEGIVIQIEGNMAKIKANRHGDCSNCGACPGDKAMVVDAINTIGAKPGQHVSFEIKEVNMLKAAFVVYILPLISIFIGAVIGGFVAKKIAQDTIVCQVIGGIITFILSIIYIKFFDKAANKDEKMKPIITRILS
ncbi:SoxR reducing system RseC family protein [Clostridium scatologenes]|uniref:Positive regulator of sigma E, RseC/MucC n=1 Tax=Clostridium scatologenes TaxID=1548 RepID=A0A0E3JP81_CLOSL|nr:SoxR reducing system RseC family protein [Clostridium scatologenes]AKA70098.1 positive regulator of sigma E, RseC/MucC [Clostridium scatologenes]